MMEEISLAKDLTEAFRSFFEHEDWNYTYHDDKGLFELGMQADGVIKRITFFVDIRDSSYLVYAVCPIGPDASDPYIMSAMAEFLCRVNYGLVNGNFELDMNDGEIRYKIFVDCTLGLPPMDTISRNIGFPLFMYDRYGEGIVSIILDKTTAEEAFEKCEEDRSEAQPSFDA